MKRFQQNSPLGKARRITLEDPRFFQAPVLEVAPKLLGKELVHREESGHTTAGIIIEVEAYGGTAEDKACHAYRRKTDRNWAMFEAGGIYYLYRIYGCYWCLNIVTGPAGSAEAVLIRALLPTTGQRAMQQRRVSKKGKLPHERRLCAGPGMLCDALALSRDFNGKQVGGSLSLQHPQISLTSTEIVTTPRIGISQSKELPWRFVYKEYEKSHCAGRPPQL